MDKRIIFAVAGSGKTTHIVENLSSDKHSLIVTYTNSNCDNLSKKITAKFCGKWPPNVTLMTYFTFLYRFCYKPFLSDKFRANGVLYEPNKNQYSKQANLDYYMTNNRYIYSNRLGFFMEKEGIVEDIKNRIKSYFDEFILDEVQDIAGRDFSFLESIMTANVNMLFVGDFYQHTFNTSCDGNVNKALFDNKAVYEKRFTKKGFVLDNVTLKNSWRCTQSVCSYITSNLGIEISSNRSEAENSLIEFVADIGRIDSILNDAEIVKLHYKNSAKYGANHKNWGDSKGEDHHQDVCVMLNKTTARKYATGKLNELKPSTKNRLYVAITRARGNVYFVNEPTM